MEDNQTASVELEKSVDVSNTPSTNGESKSSSLRSELRKNLNGGVKEEKPSENRKEYPDKERKETKTVESSVKEISMPLPSNEVTSSIPQENYLLPPADMTKEEKEAYQDPSTPQNRATLLKYINRRAYETRSDYTKKTQEIADREKYITDITQVVTPEIRDEYAKRGISPGNVVQRALAWDKAFQTNPIQAAREYLDAYGIDPILLTEDRDPSEASMGSNFSKEDAIEVVKEQLAAEFEAREQQRIAYDSYQALQSFMASKPVFQDPETGSQVERAMEPFVTGLRASYPQAPVGDILEYAYKAVMSAHPTFSGLSSQLTAKKDVETATQEALKAESASRSISGGPGSGTPKKEFKNTKEALAYFYNR